MTTIHCGNNLAYLKTLASQSVDSICTDPPYGLRFMNNHWDYSVPSVELWKECYRVLKPGGHLLSFGGSRTYHRLVVNIEDAGFEIRDMIAWIYGSGFPKNHDVSKAIDRKAGKTPKVVGKRTDGRYSSPGTDIRGGNFVGGKGPVEIGLITEPATDEAAQYKGWGTALKPAIEPIVVARRPLAGTLAENIVLHMTGGLHIEACRVDSAESWVRLQGSQTGLNGEFLKGKKERPRTSSPGGRWPANIIHDGSDQVLAMFPDAIGQIASPKRDGSDQGNRIYGKLKNAGPKTEPRDELDKSASRFFYCAKASKRDRDEGTQFLEAVQFAQSNGGKGDIQRGGDNKHYKNNVNALGLNKIKEYRNFHPTVKPTALMAYLIRLVTPIGGTVLDPYAGSGSTGKAAILERFNCILVEQEEKFIPIIQARCAYAELKVKELPLTGEELIQLLLKQES